jgi:hypothetical protein
MRGQPNFVAGLWIMSCAVFETLAARGGGAVSRSPTVLEVDDGDAKTAAGGTVAFSCASSALVFWM